MQPEQSADAGWGCSHPDVDEDCLYLNVWSAAKEGDKLPVMVWIYGGSFMSGDSFTNGVYDGAKFAVDGVVCVTLNYRLSVLGFLDMEKISGGEVGSANCALQDQALALKWVHENIAAFGGDPDNVTIFGESAGGCSVENLLVMPQTEGLFKRAIIQSGLVPALDAETMEARSNEFLAGLGIAPEDYRKLWDVPAIDLMVEAFKYPQMYFCPWVDGTVIPEYPYDMMAEGKAHGDEVLVGSNRDEYDLISLFIPGYAEWTDEEIEQRAAERYGAMWEELRASYEAAGYGKLDKRLYNYLGTDTMFAYPAQAVAEKLSTQKAVWMYRFEVVNPEDGLLPVSSYHGSEILYVFNELNQHGLFVVAKGAEGIAEEMHRVWLNFAKNGNPGPVGNLEWSRYDSATRSAAVFRNEGVVVEEQAYPRRELYYDICDKSVFHPELD